MPDLRHNRIDDVISEISARLRINSRRPLAQHNLGAAHEKRGDRRHAIERYPQEREINPLYLLANHA